MAAPQEDVKEKELSFEEMQRQAEAEAFDKPSPMLDIGTPVADEDEGGDDPGAFDNPPSGGEPAAGVEEPAALDEPSGNKHRISYNGTEYDFGDEELKQLAARGIEYSTIQSRLLPYAQVISAIEADPRLGEAVVNAIKAYRGVPAARPEADNSDPNKEPEIGENESYDDYEKRLAKWREKRSQRMVDERVSAHIRHLQESSRQQQIAYANQQIINYVQADPDREMVMKVIGSEKFPAGLRQQMEFDGALFMSVYDSIREGRGLKPYFGAPSIWNPRTQPQQNKAKEQTRTPFAERAAGQQKSTGGGVADEGLPDFKKMSDEEFRKYKAQVMFKGII